MKIKSLLFIIVAFLLVAVISYYIGGSMKGANPDKQMEYPAVESEYSSSFAKNNLVPSGRDQNAAYITSPVTAKSANSTETRFQQTNQEQITAPAVSPMVQKHIEIEAEFERKKKDVETYYADKFRQLQQRKEIFIKKYDSISLYDVSDRVMKMLDKGMYEYELEYKHLQNQKACALDDLEKEKALALATVRSQGANQSAPITSTAAQGTVTGIIYSEENPLALIDGKVLHEGQSLRGVKIVKINQDSAEFEHGDNRWGQRVNEPPSNNWP